MSFALKIILFSAIFTPSLQTKVKAELVDNPSKFVNILHFNDAYDVYWAPQFAKKFMSMSDSNTLRTFSGDLYSPSSETRYLRGAQFQALLKAIKLDVAVPGNHEFDMMVDQFNKLQEQDMVRWLKPNFIKNPALPNHETAKSTKKLLTSLLDYLNLTVNDIKVCFFGLFDKPSYLASRLPRTDLIITDPLQKAREMSKELRKKGCDLIIVLSHMNNETDEEILKDSENDVDIVLGGHIHQFRVNVINKRLLLKSGHDFFDFSKSKLSFSKTPIQKDLTKDFQYEFVFKDETDLSTAPKSWKFSFAKEDGVYLNVELNKYRVEKSDPVDENVKKHLMEVVDPVMSKIRNQIAFSIDAPQNIKDNNDRKRVFPLYNLLIDLVRAEFGNDIAILNTGAFRLKKNIAAGEKLSALDLDSFFPFDDDLNQLTIPGSEIPALLNDILNFLLENAAMAGITFKYKQDDRGLSVIPETIKINGENLDNNRDYILVTSSYFASGQMASTLKNQKIQDSKKVLKGFNEQGVIMKYMKELVNPANVKEFDCFKTHLPEVKTDHLIKYYKAPVDSSKGKKESLCEAAKTLSSSIKDKTAAILNAITPNVLKRLMVYSLMGDLKKGAGADKTTYFEAKMNREEVAVLQKLLI